MRLAFLTPGTGSFFCGSCLRDALLVEGLRRRGHRVRLVPLYLPLLLEEGPAEGPVHMGGVNVYLQHRFPWARRLPGRFQDLLDAPGLLRWASRRGGLTAPGDLGELTLSMLAGETGRQAHELEKLVEALGREPPVDAVVLSNALLVGLARRLVEGLGVGVLCTFQGEAPFLDALPGAAREHAWRLVGERARDVRGFCAVSGYTARLMARRLGLESGRIGVVPNGIDPACVRGSGRVKGPPAVGYLARLCPEKGLALLFEAFEKLARRPGLEQVRLEALGTLQPGDRAGLRELLRRVRSAGLAERVRFRPNADRGAKREFLSSIDVLSVPATYGESFGLYVLEAWANGVPVVQPRHGAFPELVEATGGGWLVEPDDAAALADALEALLRSPEQARELGRRGREGLARDYTVERMAARFEAWAAPFCGARSGAEGDGSRPCGC